VVHAHACVSIDRLGAVRFSKPEVIEYLKTPPTKARLRELVTATGIPVRALLRVNGTPYGELKLGDPKCQTKSCSPTQSLSTTPSWRRR